MNTSLADGSIISRLIEAELKETLKLPKTKTKGHLINKQTDIHYYINWISYGHYLSFITQLEINIAIFIFFCKKLNQNNLR